MAEEALNSQSSLSCSPGIVSHLPHDAMEIPAEVRGQFVLNDAELAEELLRMTDHATTWLFGLDVYDPAVVRAPVSQLVVNVERFPDDAKEPLAARVMGVIYRQTSEGRPPWRPLSARLIRQTASFSSSWMDFDHLF